MSNRKVKKSNIEKNIQKNEEDVLRKAYNHYLDTPLKLLEILKRLNNCRKFLQYQNIEDWIYMFMSYLGCYTVIGSGYKERILYALIFVLRDLHGPFFTPMLDYIENPDALLEKVISVAEEEKGWKLDKISALGLCSKIIVDYTFEEINQKGQEEYLTSTDEQNIIYVDKNDHTSPLRQIIRGYPSTAIDETVDCIWEWYIDQLLLKHDEDEDLVEELYDLKDLEARVRRREILPECYNIVV